MFSIKRFIICNIQIIFFCLKSVIYKKSVGIYDSGKNDKIDENENENDNEDDNENDNEIEESIENEGDSSDINISDDNSDETI